MDLTDVFPHPVAPMTLQEWSVLFGWPDYDGDAYAIVMGAGWCSLELPSIGEEQEIGIANSAQLYSQKSTGPERALA